jgi:hypothetical protein
VSWRQGDLERTARLLGATEALRHALDAPLSPEEQRLPSSIWRATATDAPLSSEEQRAREEQLASLLAALGDAAFTAAWKAGQALTWEQAVAEALGETERVT